MRMMGRWLSLLIVVSVAYGQPLYADVNIAAQAVPSDGSTNTVTCNTTTGLATVRCSSASDFANGQYVLVANAGATCGSVGSNCTPVSTPTVTFHGSGTGTDWCYAVSTGDGLGGWSTLSPPITINATSQLDNANVNTLNFSATANDTEYAVYRGSAPTGDTCTPTQYIGSVMNGPIYGRYPIGNVIFFDFLGTWAPATTYTFGNFIVDSNGNIERVSAAGSSGSSQPIWPTTPGGTTNDGDMAWTLVGIPPIDVANNASVLPLHDDLSAEIVSGGGTNSWTLSASAGATLSSAVTGHDDAPLFNLAFNAYHNYAFFDVPAQTYILRSRMTIPGGAPGTNASDLTVAAGGAELLSFYDGPTLVVNSLAANSYVIKDLVIQGLNIVGQGQYNLDFGAQWGVMMGDAQRTTFYNPDVEQLGGGGFFVAEQNSTQEQFHLIGAQARSIGGFPLWIGPAFSMLPDDIEVEDSFFNQSGKLIPNVTGDTNLSAANGFCAVYLSEHTLSFTGSESEANYNDDNSYGYLCGLFVNGQVGGPQVGGYLAGNHYEINGNTQAGSYDEVLGAYSQGILLMGETHAGITNGLGVLKGVLVRSPMTSVINESFCPTPGDGFLTAIDVAQYVGGLSIWGLHGGSTACNGTPTNGWVTLGGNNTGIIGPTPDNPNTYILGDLITPTSLGQLGIVRPRPDNPNTYIPNTYILGGVIGEEGIAPTYATNYGQVGITGATPDDPDMGDASSGESSTPTDATSYDQQWADSTAQSLNTNNSDGMATTLSNGDAGSCTNQAVTAVNSGGAPTCRSPSQAMAPRGFHRSFWGANATGLTWAGTLYIAASGVSSYSSAERVVELPVPVAATLKNLYCVDTAAPGTGNSDAITIRVAGSNSSVHCTISGGATSCRDTSDSTSPTAGQLIDIQDVTTGTPSRRYVKCSFELDI